MPKERTTRLLPDAHREYEDRLSVLDALSHLAQPQVRELLTDSALDLYRSALRSPRISPPDSDRDFRRVINPVRWQDCFTVTEEGLPSESEPTWGWVFGSSANDEIVHLIEGWVLRNNIAFDWMRLAAHHSIGSAYRQRRKGLLGAGPFQMYLDADPVSLLFGGRSEQRYGLDGANAIACLWFQADINDWAAKALTDCDPRFISEEKWVEQGLSLVRPSLSWFYRSVKGIDDQHYGGKPRRRISERGKKSFDWLVLHLVLGQSALEIAESVVAQHEREMDRSPGDDSFADPDYDHDDRVRNKIKDIRQGIGDAAKRVGIPNPL